MTYKEKRKATWDEIDAYLDKEIACCKEYESHCKKMALEALADGRPSVAELYERNRNNTEYVARRAYESLKNNGLWKEEK